MGVVSQIVAGAAEGGFSGLRGIVRDIGDTIRGKSVLTGQETVELEKLANSLEIAALELERSELEARGRVIEAEAKSESWLTANWRPSVMLVFTYIVFNNYILSPYVKCFYPEFPVLPVPEQLWSLLTVGLGGYVVGRSAEKVVKEWKRK
jgi:hypothetical protein